MNHSADRGNRGVRPMNGRDGTPCRPPNAPSREKVFVVRHPDLYSFTG